MVQNKSKLFTTSYTGALDASSQLMLGMLKLEGTDSAVTAKQADAMLRSAIHRRHSGTP